MLVMEEPPINGGNGRNPSGREDGYGLNSEIDLLWGDFRILFVR